MTTYIYFYIHAEKGVIVSPYFDTEEDAKEWLKTYTQS